MRLLIGCPVHECKDYGIERFIGSVAALELPEGDSFMLMLVDNSPTASYSARLEGLCRQSGLRHFHVQHLPDLPQETDDDWALRLGLSREAIRKELTRTNGYDFDWWWSLECDVIVPPGTWRKLKPLTQHFDAVHHNYPAHYTQYAHQEGMGCLLIRRELMLGYRFDEGPGLTGEDVYLNGWLLSNWRVGVAFSLVKVEHLSE